MSTIPEYVYVAIEEFRFGAEDSLYDCDAAIAYAGRTKQLAAADWLAKNRDRYVEAVRLAGARLAV